MKILVLDRMRPFVRSSMEHVGTELVSALRDCGAEAEIFRLPFRDDDTEGLLDGPGPRKLAWLLDGSAEERASALDAGPRIRFAAEAADSATFAKAERIYATTPEHQLLIAEKTDRPCLYLPVPDAASSAWRTVAQSMIT
jgi:hypothetical protein